MHGNRSLTLGLSALLPLGCAAIAFGHPGHGGHGAIETALHPLSGADHLAALLALGLLIGRFGVRFWLTASAALIVCMTAGAFAAPSGVAPAIFSLSSALVVASLGVLVWRQSLATPRIALAVVIVSGLALGFTHSTALGVGGGGAFAGAIVGRLFLVAVGVLAWKAIHARGDSKAFRFAGASIVTCAMLVALSLFG